MKKHLTDIFSFNSKANKKMLEKIKLLNDKTECIRLFSHLINSQIKWMARITQHPRAQEMSWWDPVYDFAQLERKWNESLQPWLDYIEEKSEQYLSSEVTFTGFDGSPCAATPLDIALQLNYHSIHHRAQMQMIIRSQGVEPDFVDYIGTRYRKLA